MPIATLAELDGKRAFIEVREGRRWHRMVVAILRHEEDGLYAVFSEAYTKNYPEPAKIKIPEKQYGHFSRVAHANYDLKMESVLYRIAHQSDDTPAGLTPPVVVTQADIDAAKDHEANQSPHPTLPEASADD